METELYKIRGVQACFRAAYDLFTSNIKTIIKKTWKPALMMSALMSLYQTVLANSSASLSTGLRSMQEIVVSIITIIVAAIACLAASIWFYTTIMSLLNGRKKKENGKRVLRAVLLYLALLAALSIVTLLIAGLAATISLNQPSERVPIPMVRAYVVAFLLVIVWGIFAIPTTYSCMKYLMEPARKVGSILGKPYRLGWHHWGFLFICAFLVCIISWIGGILTQIPSYIMLLALMISRGGEAIGDPSGLPSHFLPTYYVINTLCTFVWCQLIIWVVMVYYYAYGSIESRIKETTQVTV